MTQILFQTRQILSTSDPLATSRAWVEVDLEALRHNLRLLRHRIRPEAEIWAVVKANAYGHGLQIVASQAVAAGCSGICVATLAEGMELRHSGLSAPILILGALNTLPEIDAAARMRLDITLTSAEQIPLLAQVASSQGIRVPYHLDIDTGMTRLGVPWQQAPALWRELSQRSELDCRSLYSHLATADEPDPSTMRLQQERFAWVVAQIRASGWPLPRLHLDNSAGALADPASHYQAVRLGLVLYGIPPAPHLQLPGLRPLLTVKARITHLQVVAAGTGVSYGHRHITAAAARIATAAIGYADGIPRRLSGWLHGSVRGQSIPQVGTITMDQCMWDVTHLPKVEVGDEVELLGGDPTDPSSTRRSVQAWADQLGTIPYEILCGFSARLPRLGIHES